MSLFWGRRSPPLYVNQVGLLPIIVELSHVKLVELQVVDHDQDHVHEQETYKLVGNLNSHDRRRWWRWHSSKYHSPTQKSASMRHDDNVPLIIKMLKLFLVFYLEKLEDREMA